jgi:hypothetical protein
MRLTDPKPPKKTSLSSKLREFWILHPSALVAIVCAVFLAIAIVILCIVGTHQHWNLRVFFTSPSAILIYVVAGFIVIIYVFQKLIFKRW